MSVRLDVHAFALARSPGERSEDAWAVDVDEGRLAVADGASSAWRAGDWAAALVDAWIAGPPGRPRAGGRVAGFLRWLDTVREGFDAPTDGAERAWFAEAAAARGAHAALLGVRVTGLGGRRPRLVATAVGDVCLMVVRDGMLDVALPLDDPDAFGTRPSLVSSLPGGGLAGARSRSCTETAVRADDLLLLASDALAAFLLQLAADARDAVWPAMRRLDTAGLRAARGRGRSRPVCSSATT
jgi:hypothetical protein